MNGMLRRRWTRVAGVSASLLIASLAIAAVSTATLPTSTDAAETLPRDPAPGTYDHMSISCGSAITTVAGRVVYRAVTSEFRPLRGVRFTLSTHGTVHCSPTPARVKVRQDRAARFSLPLILWSDSIDYYQGKLRVLSRSVDDKGTMLLEADNCEAMTVEIDDAWTEHDLEMSCPGRQ